MRIGFPNNPAKSLYEEVEWVVRNGFDFVDLFLECPILPERVNLSRLKKIIYGNGLSATGHLGWYIPTGSSEKAIRDAAIMEAESYFTVFEHVGAKYVTVHANWEAGFSESDCIKFQAATLREMVKKAKEYNISLMYEPVDSIHDTVKNTRKILEDVPGMFFHLDIGHANLHGKSPIDFIDAFHKKMVHVHMHDNDGRCDLHLPIGSGTIDWESVIRSLKSHYDGTITLEIFSRDRSSVLKSRERLLELWEGKK